MEIKKIFFMVVNVDWFFISHRLPLALKMKSEGYDVYILTKDTGHKSEVEKSGLNFIDIPFKRSGKNPLREFATIIKLKKIIKKYKPQIIHNVTIKPVIYGSIAAKFAHLKSSQVINAISGLGYNFINNRNSIVQRMIKRMMKYAFSGNVKFIFQNPDDKNTYEHFGFLHNNYKIIKGAGVDGNLFTQVEPIQKDKIYIVTTARMLYDKGIQELIDASSILYEKYYGKILFLLVGDLDLDNPSGIPEDKLKGAVKEDYFSWVGHKKDVRPILIESDIVCLPSYREGLPKSLIEAMAIGRPIVTTDVPGCRECVDEGYNGLLVPSKDATALANALEKLINDKDSRIKMGNASRDKMMSELSLEKVLTDTLNFYES